MKNMTKLLVAIVIAFSFNNVNAQSKRAQADVLDWGYSSVGQTFITGYNITGSTITTKSIVGLDTSQFFILQDQIDNSALIQTVDSFVTRIDFHEGNPWQLVAEFASADATDTIFVAGTVYSTHTFDASERDVNQRITVVDTILGTDASTLSSYHWTILDSVWQTFNTSATYSILGAPIFAITPATTYAEAIGVISGAVADSAVVNVTIFGHVGEGTLDGNSPVIVRGDWLIANGGNDFTGVGVGQDSIALAKALYYSNGDAQFGVIIMK